MAKHKATPTQQPTTPTQAPAAPATATAAPAATNAVPTPLQAIAQAVAGRVGLQTPGAWRTRTNQATATVTACFKPTAGGSTHVTVCCTHGYAVHSSNAYAAKQFAYAPGGPTGAKPGKGAPWCPQCMAHVQATNPAPGYTYALHPTAAPLPPLPGAGQ